MSQWLNDLYLQPYHSAHKPLRVLQHYYKRLGLLMLMLITAYPLVDLGRAYYFSRYYQQRVQMLSDEIGQQQKILAGLMQYQQYQQADRQFTQLNEKLNALIEKYQINTEQMQWQFEQGKQVYLVLNQKSLPMFAFIRELDQFDKSVFRKLQLIKLNQQRLIQLQAELVFE